MSDFITIQKAAEILGVCERTVRNRLSEKGWESHLETVQGDGYKTQRRVIARDDVLEDAGLAADPEDSERFPAARSERFSQVGNALQDVSECLPELVERLEASRRTRETEVATLKTVSERLPKLAESMERVAEAREKEAKWRRRTFFLTLGGTLGALAGLGVAIWSFLTTMQNAPLP